MSSQDIFKAIGTLIFFALFQVLFVRNLVLFDIAFCFVYIMAILWLPGEWSTIWVILASFALGLFIDMFYNTAGLHAAACTFLGYFRKNLLRYFFPSRGIENEIHVNIKKLGTQRYLIYVSIMVFIHCTLLFFIEAGGFFMIGFTILKILTSFIFTVLVIFLISVFTANQTKEKSK